MPVQVRWHPTLPNTLCYDFTRKWTWQDYFAAFEKELEMVQILDGETYHVLADFLQATIFPTGPGMTYIYGSAKKSPPNMGTVVILTHSALIHTFVRLFGTIYPDVRKTMQLADNLEDAEALVRALHLTWCQS